MSNTTTLEHSERFKAYTLSRLLPEGDTLVLDSDQGVLSQMHQGEECMLREQQLLSPSEMYVVAALLDNYPDYCPYEVVLSEITGKSVEKCRARIEAAEEDLIVFKKVLKCMHFKQMF